MKKKRYDKLNDAAYSALKCRDCAANVFFNPGDVQFGAMLDIVSTVVAKRHEARDDDATFPEIRREILKSLMRDDRWTLTVACALNYSEFWGIEFYD